MDQAEKKGKMVFGHLLEAVGGAAKVDAVKSIKTESGMSVATPQGEFQLTSTQIFVLPDRFRRDLKTPMGTQTQVVTPASAFVQMGKMTRPMSDSQKEDGVNAMKRELVPLLQARNSPDLKVLYTGTEKVNGADCDLIGVAIGGTNVKLAVDQATGRLEQASYQGKNMQGVPGEITVTYSDHHDVDGIEMPWTSNVTFNGQKMITQEVKSMVINGEIDEAVFKMPEGATAGGPSGSK